MLPASNRGAGQNIGFPDVCQTPAGPAVVPVPYPNIAMNAQAAGFSPVVKVSGVNALNVGSKIPMTMGDEAGSASPIKGAGAYTAGNPIVFIDKLPGISLTCPTTGNNMNNPLGAVLVPSAVNVTYCRAGNSGEGRVALDELESLGRAMVSSGLSARRLPGGVACVRIEHFAPGIVTDFHRALAELGHRTAIVIDLRGNPGGELDAALALANDLLPHGRVVARIDEGGDTRVVRAVGDACTKGPVVLLVDRGTASAAEVFASSLKENARALVVGERTYGKGTAQRLADSPSGEPSRFGVASFATSGGEPLEGHGVTPDAELLPDEGRTSDTWLLTALGLALELAS